jgi:hypothetical protein
MWTPFNGPCSQQMWFSCCGSHRRSLCINKLKTADVQNKTLLLANLDTDGERRILEFHGWPNCGTQHTAISLLPVRKFHYL